MLYKKLLKFKRKYPITLVFRLKKHCKLVEGIIDKEEKVLYAFCGQRNDSYKMFCDSCVVALTNKRIIVGEKRLLWGYIVKSVTPDLFNDLTLKTGLIFGTIIIDTVKEIITISNLDKRSLDEIETNVNKIMLDNKKKLKELKELKEKKENLE